jgi:hypothetical protein
MAGGNLARHRRPRARRAVAIGFGADHETIPLRDGDESSMRISQGQLGSRRAAVSDIGDTSDGMCAICAGETCGVGQFGRRLSLP